MTFACFHVSGKIPCWRYKLKRLVNGFHIVLAVSFKTWGLITSGPGAFAGLSVTRIYCTSFSPRRIDVNRPSVINWAAGSVVCESSTVECETKKLLSALALLILSWIASPDGNNRAGMLWDFEFSICCLIVCHHPRPPISSNSKLLICLFSYASLDKARQWTYSFRMLRYFDHASLVFF